jgi:hypothetical protein
MFAYPAMTPGAGLAPVARPRVREQRPSAGVCTGEVRAPTEPSRGEPGLVIDVAKLIWEPIAD